MGFLNQCEYEIAMRLRKIPGLYNMMRKFYVQRLLRRKKILSCVIFITNRCNLACKHCYIWAKKQKIDLGYGILSHLADDYLLKRVVFVLTGGEFELHPDIEKILPLFNRRKHIVASNGFLYKRIIELVKGFKIRVLQLSLDGDEQTHNKMRGNIKSYENIIKIIETLRFKTNIHLSYTVAPWNTPEDLKHVKAICLKYRLNLGINYLYNPTYYDVRHSKQRLYDASNVVNDFYHYSSRYRDWYEGRLKIPCHSIKLLPFIFPEGDVVLCSSKTEVVLGNVKNKQFFDIWHSDRVRAIHKQYLNCNDCWSSCNRALDLQICKIAKL